MKDFIFIFSGLVLVLGIHGKLVTDSLENKNTKIQATAHPPPNAKTQSPVNSIPPTKSHPAANDVAHTKPPQVKIDSTVKAATGKVHPTVKALRRTRATRKPRVFTTKRGKKAKSFDKKAKSFDKKAKSFDKKAKSFDKKAKSFDKKAKSVGKKKKKKDASSSSSPEIEYEISDGVTEETESEPEYSHDGGRPPTKEEYSDVESVEADSEEDKYFEEPEEDEDEQEFDDDAGQYDGETDEESEESGATKESYRSELSDAKTMSLPSSSSDEDTPSEIISDVSKSFGVKNNKHTRKLETESKEARRKARNKAKEERRKEREREKKKRKRIPRRYGEVKNVMPTSGIEELNTLEEIKREFGSGVDSNPVKRKRSRVKVPRGKDKQSRGGGGRDYDRDNYRKGGGDRGYDRPRQYDDDRGGYRDRDDGYRNRGSYGGGSNRYASSRGQGRNYRNYGDRGNRGGYSRGRFYRDDRGRDYRGKKIVNRNKGKRRKEDRVEDYRRKTRRFKEYRPRNPKRAAVTKASPKSRNKRSPAEAEILPHQKENFKLRK